MNNEGLLKEFMELVEIDSPSKQEGAVAKVIKKKLEEIGLEVWEDQAHHSIGGDTGNLIAKLKGSIDGPPILFSSHMDTVHSGIGIIPIIREGTVYSRGDTILGADNKAGIAAILEALRQIKETAAPHRDIEVVFTVCEEIGLLGSKHLDYTLLDAQYGFVLDSDGDPGEIIIQGPTQEKLNVTVLGRSAHAGLAPEEGISALMVAAEAITKMNLLRIDEETTANIGMIKGGEATNIVMPRLHLYSEVRSKNTMKAHRQVEHMIKCFQDAANENNAQVEIERYTAYPPFLIDKEHFLVKKVFAAFAKIGIKAFTASTSGGSDANILNQNNIPTVTLGIGMKNPHTTDEKIEIEDLINTARVALELMKSI